MSNGIFIQLGSNLGDRTHWLDTAKAYIETEIGVIAAQSCVYETKPWGVENQSSFLNQVIEIETALTPTALLDACLGIELTMGRQREIKWGPRNIDIDILFYHDEVITSAELMLPHPRIAERMFVLAPLCEIAPYFIHPVEMVTCTDLMRICLDHAL